MAAKAGEENITTLYGDIHYFYGPPDERPRHHRFDKGSYVYLFENASERRARIEVANNVGTDDQDDFEGYLDKAHLRYSYKHQCLVSLTVGDTSNPGEWHLPTFDPRNENKYHYPLHSLDIYFWTQTDALQFVNGIRTLLPASQAEILDEPGPPAHAPGSSLVQQLEQVALSESESQSQEEKAPEQPANFAPMAYNPAAPAAPEAIQHREKTPPPEDGGVNPLAVAMVYDQQQQQPYHAGLPPPPPPPGQPPLASPGLPPQHFGGPHPGLTRAATMPLHAGLASPGLANPYGGGAQGFASPPAGASPSHGTPPVTNPGVHPPPGGQPQYGYGHHHHHHQHAPGTPGYPAHQQPYRPSEAENPSRFSGKGKLEEHTGRLERGVGGMFKKFEKKFG